ncbi:GH13968 [Drosophila grimshawi]|uniref:GH13968 n=1 Tax=Drosophila grimshawi TaxID=7222 RepID=B4JYS0_DROGR|nr:GH13968 [Drosophila grimshawi]
MDVDVNVDGTHHVKTVWAAGEAEGGENTEWAASDSAESKESLSSTTTTPPTTTTTTGSESVDYSAYVTLIPWELIQQNGKSEKLQEMREALLSQQQQQLPIYREERVQVVIHNITQISESELQMWNSTGNTVVDSDAYVNLKFNERPVANQTELIYTVLVNGRPVLATTAAKDMELVSEAEAVSTLGKPIYMKSEPYIREPTATALAPVPRSGHAGFFNSVKNNVALVVISSLAILLLMLLLVAILLLGRTRARQHELSEVNRTSSRNELLSEGQSMRPSSRGTLLDSAAGGSGGNPADQSTTRSRDVGVQNFSYEREPRISFPGPPAEKHTRVRHDSISSADNTSDSSVYCPINPPSADVQRILDDKAARLFDGHKRRRHQYDRAEGGLDDTIYASVVSEKKNEKSRHKSKRRYLNENRVGSLETSPVQGSLGQSNSSTEEGNSPAAMRRSYENFQRNEAYNPHNNYHRNKLLQQQQQTIFTDKEYPEDGVVGSPQAINREMIRSRGAQQSEKSSDTASVGSFLSMASVRAFPKNQLPEPLNRVLDPVFVTYYDNVNAVAPQAAPQSSTRSLKSHKSLGSRDTTIATIASFPSPKAPPVRNVRSASHSDNPDPGFVGPVVWERHKKRLGSSADNQEARSHADFNPSQMHDASAIRNHYEGLLEGAMQMYASQDDLPMPLPSRDFTNKRRQTTKREHRGSSAGLPR